MSQPTQVNPLAFLTEEQTQQLREILTKNQDQAGPRTPPGSGSPASQSPGPLRQKHHRSQPQPYSRQRNQEDQAKNRNQEDQARNRSQERNQARRWNQENQARNRNQENRAWDQNRVTRARIDTRHLPAGFKVKGDLIKFEDQEFPIFRRRENKFYCAAVHSTLPMCMVDNVLNPVLPLPGHQETPGM